jgi:RNA polymerase sporulation-specific sigma factor
MRISFVENYKNLSDDQVIELYNNGNHDMLQVIIERYYPVIFYYAKKYCPEKCYEDAISSATLALYSALKDFDSSKASFKTFASLCIKRGVLGVLKSHNSQKNIPDELLSSIDDLDIIDSNSPEKIFFDREDYKALADTIKLELSALEYDVIQHYLAGEKYSDIAKKLEISEKSVENALSRIRKKLKR